MKNDMSLINKPSLPAARRMFALGARFAMLSGLLFSGITGQAQNLGKYFPLYISSYDNSTIYKLDSSGNRTVFTSGGNINGAHGIAFDAHGNLYVSSIGNNTIVKVNSAGQQSVFTTAGLIAGPRGLAFDKAGNLYVACYDSNRVVKVDSTGKQTLFAAIMNFAGPSPLAFDTAGNLYVGNSIWWVPYPADGIVKIDPAGNQSVFVWFEMGADGLAFDTSGLLWAGSINEYSLGAFQADGNRAPGSPYVAVFPQAVEYVFLPSAIAFDYKGNLWASDFLGRQEGFYVGTVTFLLSDPLWGSPAAELKPVTTTPGIPVSLAFSTGYTTAGFTAPIANPPAVNTGKAGRTYPVKWTMTNPDGSLATAVSAVKSITYQPVACGSFGNATGNVLPTTETGNSSLRYDSGANQFIYNWATPSTTGCYDLIVTLDSLQTLTAYFNLN